MKFIVEVKMPYDTAERIAGHVNRVHRAYATDEMIDNARAGCYDFLETKFAEVVKQYTTLGSMEVSVTRV